MQERLLPTLIYEFNFVQPLTSQKDCFLLIPYMYMNKYKYIKFMEAISYTAVRSNLAKTMEKVCLDRKPIIITRQNADSVVMISLEDYEALQETAYLLRSPANAERLSRSIADIEAGKVVEKELDLD
jgi:antitoxin YefM